MPLIIGLDGDSHYTPEAIAYDSERINFLMDKGFKVMCFTNLEVMQNRDGILSAIVDFIQNS